MHWEDRAPQTFSSPIPTSGPFYLEDGLRLVVWGLERPKSALGDERSTGLALSNSEDPKERAGHPGGAKQWLSSSSINFWDSKDPSIKLNKRKLCD